MAQEGQLLAGARVFGIQGQDAAELVGCSLGFTLLQETETQITKRIEDVVATISKIDFIRSFSMENASFVMIKFDLGKDVDIATQEVKDKVNSILSDLPEDAKLPVVQKFDMSAEPIIDIILTGNFDTKTLYE